jgi:hypothetical protein
MTGQHLYRGLLYLYPKPFQTHFGPEMLRLYQDCYPECGGAGFWIETVKDLATSIPREWYREFCRDDNSIDYTGLADAVMCSIVVGTLLFGWGLLGACFALHRRVPEAGLLFALVTIAMAVLVGIIAKYAAARSGVIDTTCSPLISYERTTVRFSR